MTSIRLLLRVRDKKLWTSGRKVWATYVDLISTYVDIRIKVPGLKDYVHRQKKSTMGRRFFLHENDAFSSAG